MSNAPDLLARMLVRAAGADAAINGNTGAAAANQNADSAPPPSPSLLAARFASLLGEDTSAIASGTPSSASGQNGASTNSDANANAFAQTPAQAPAPANNALVSNTLAYASSLLMQVRDASSSSATSGPPVDANAVVEQLVKSMVMRTDQQGTSEIRLQLQPENLGTVTMKLTVSGSQVSANVVASSADVRNTIVANHQELARSLADAGLTLSGFSVDVSGGDAGNDQSKDRTAGFGRRFTVHEVGGASTEETASDSSSGPQLLGNSKSLELFNYLA